MIHRGYNRAPRRQLIPNLFSNILKVIAEADRPLTHHEIVEAVSRRMERSDEELSRQITVSLQDALIYGYLRVKNFRYSIVPHRLDPNEPRDLTQFNKSPVASTKSEMPKTQINQRQSDEQSTSKRAANEKHREGHHQHPYSQSGTVSGVDQDRTKHYESVQGGSNSQARESSQPSNTQPSTEMEERIASTTLAHESSIQSNRTHPGNEAEEETNATQNATQNDYRPGRL